MIFLSLAFNYSCSTAAIMSPCEISYNKETVYNKIKLPFDAKVNLIIEDPDYDGIQLLQNDKEYHLKKENNRFYSTENIPMGTYRIKPPVDAVQSFYLENENSNFNSGNNDRMEHAVPVQNSEKDSVSMCLGDRDDWFVMEKKCMKGHARIKVSSRYPKEIKAKLIDGDREINLIINKQILFSSQNKKHYMDIFTDEKSGQYDFSVKYEEECLPLKLEIKIDAVKELQDHQTGFVLAAGKDEGVVEGMKFVAKDQVSGTSGTCRVTEVFKSSSICVLSDKNLKVYPKTVVYTAS
jgi:hypothetical protein